MKKSSKASRVSAPPPAGALCAKATAIACMIGISRAKFLALVKDGLAPPGEKLGRNRLWEIAKIQTWIADGFKPN